MTLRRRNKQPLPAFGPGVQVQAAQLPGKALLWLVAAFTLLLVPQWDRLPVWLLGICVALMGWRWLARLGRVRLPERWWRTGLVVVLGGVYLATVNSQLTVDTAASFFALCVALKWLETRSARDFYVLFFILLYMAAVNFLFHQAIHWTLLNFTAVMSLLLGLQVLNAPELPAGVRSGGRRLAGLLLKMLPVVIVLFVFFPRMAPLWSVPLVSSQARSGISDQMTPGDISNLAQSSKRVFRVSFGGQTPPQAQRYWRGLTLDYLDGATWKQSAPPASQRLGRVEIEGASGPLDANQYEILLEPTDQSWTFALADSVAASPNIKEIDDDLFRFRRPADTSVRYRLALEASPLNPNAQLPPALRRQLLQLPGRDNPQARALADELRSRYDDRDVAAALLQRFREQPYFYTLRPPAMPDNGIDALLFDVKRGFCAHYAGAMTFVLRAAGIPARVVVGYQGGESGAGDEYLLVRQYDAHAWVEGWFEGAGWIRLDPTAAIAPSRIESGLREAMAEEGSFLENSWLSPQKYGNLPLLTWSSLQLDRINYQWQRWVVGYQGQSQMDLLSRLPGGLTLRDLGYISAGTVAAALLLAGLISAWRDRQGGRHTGVARQLQRWQKFCEGVGVPVHQGETPLDLAERLAQAEPALADSARVFAGVVNTHYYSRQAIDAVAPSVSNVRLLRCLLSRMKRQRRQAFVCSDGSPAQSRKPFQASSEAQD